MNPENETKGGALRTLWNWFGAGLWLVAGALVGVMPLAVLGPLLDSEMYVVAIFLVAALNFALCAGIKRWHLHRALTVGVTLASASIIYLSVFALPDAWWTFFYVPRHGSMF